MHGRNCFGPHPLGAWGGVKNLIFWTWSCGISNLRGWAVDQDTLKKITYDQTDDDECVPRALAADDKITKSWQKKKKKKKKKKNPEKNTPQNLACTELYMYEEIDRYLLRW